MFIDMCLTRENVLYLSIFKIWELFTCSTHMPTHAHTHMNPHIDHTHEHTCTCASMHLCAHAYTHIRAHTHAHTYTGWEERSKMKILVHAFNPSTKGAEADQFL